MPIDPFAALNAMIRAEAARAAEPGTTAPAQPGQEPAAEPPREPPHEPPAAGAGDPRPESHGTV
ncbi:hypothetical protein [Streptomyces jumonjinensis]|uniref:hypothetical protein n=1 Tax=Streptomyces jumonjinensis TaxID=1945 RepID=UPI00379C7D8F